MIYSVSLLEDPVPDPVLSTADFSCMFLFLYTSPPDCIAYVPVPLPPSPPLLQTAGACTVFSPPALLLTHEHVKMLLPSGRHRSYAHTPAAGDATCSTACSQTVTQSVQVLGEMC